MPDIHMVDAEGVYRALETRETGLTRAEARKRLREHGPNEIRQTRRRPLYREFVAQFTHFLAGLLWIAAGLCFLSEYMRPGEGMLSLGLAIVGVIAVNAVFTFVQEYRAEKAVDALRKLLPFRVKVLREGAVREVPSRDVVPGDVFHLAEGDRVPADARVLSSDRLSVNMAPLTGESEPMPRDAAPSEEDLHESANVVLAGTLVVGGSGAAAAFATGMDTEFGRIAHLTGTVHPGRTPLQKEILKTTRVIAVIALTTGASFFILGILTGRGFWHNFIFAVGIIVANVPEGLLPTVTLSLAMASQRMARKNALIKTLPSVETLGSVTVICTDKTGTLTQNRMEVREAWSPEGAKAEMLHLAAGLCNDASRADGRYVGEPTEVALLKASEARCGTHAARREYDIPFSPEKKRMTTVDVVDGSRYVFAKGAVEAILASCGDAAEGGAHRRLIEERSRAMMDRGLRVIAFGWKECRGQAPYTDGSLEGGLSFAGLMGLEDPPRPEVPEAVRKCREAGIKVIMITGDASRTALSVARAVGL
ncbi:MAG TPA: cation-transporting P-type ATPase, partial [Nitrospirota bacterium]|nr:cation-transporting P-type ATPase [Nitrospirota bacterium]